jgi:hypothetical protein
MVQLTYTMACVDFYTYRYMHVRRTLTTQVFVLSDNTPLIRCAYVWCIARQAMVRCWLGSTGAGCVGKKLTSHGDDSIVVPLRSESPWIQA